MTGTLLTREEALARVLANVTALEAEAVPTGSSAGRFLVVDARAAVDLPPFPSSAMDGFAVRVDDTPGTLVVVERVAAGVPSSHSLSAGEAMGIATGGVVPDGADAVVPIEYVVEHDNEVDVPEPVALAANVRPRGGDVRAGDLVVSAGTRIAAAQIGALAAAGIAHVACTRRPRVAVLSTGTELRPPGEELGPGQVYEANAAMLVAAMAAANAVVDALPAAVDDEDVLRAALERALAADVVVTSGGVSVGPHDLVRRIERELGVDEIFWGVAVKPGKPVSFGVRGRTLVFGLPGNPVSSLVGCELFVLPALRALQGAAEPGPVYEPGRLAAAVRRNAHRDELLRARRTIRDGEVLLDPIIGQESHMIARAAGTDALLLAPIGTGELAVGERVRYLPLV